MLLERIFLLEHLSPWHTNRLSRLIKSPKLHMTDTGFASALLGATVETLSRDRALYGQMLETFVFQELRKQASWYDVPVGFARFRNKDGVEVDFDLRCISLSANMAMRDLRTLQIDAERTFIQTRLRRKYSCFCPLPKIPVFYLDSSDPSCSCGDGGVRIRECGEIGIRARLRI